MSFLVEEDIEFARRHIQRFYDTDFFPKHFALDALWHCWKEVKPLIGSSLIRELPLSTPEAIVWPKPKGGFRVVHQLDPLSSVVYSAIAHSVAPSIEVARTPKADWIACSYRFAISDGSYFDSGTGYDEFQTQTKLLASSHSYVLITDITDFYNQIYIHRIRNAISFAAPNLNDRAEETEKLLMRWTSSNSQGLPVGPAASIIFAEAVLIDVDQFLRNKGVRHTRYVDDFRIFGSSEEQLRQVLRELTLYLYETHRLHLAGSKTHLSTSSEMLDAVFENPYELEKINIFEEVGEILNPYTLEMETAVLEAGRAEAEEVLSLLMDRILKLPSLEVGLARAVIRRAKGLRLDTLVARVFEGMPKLLPVVNDVFLYIDTVCWPAAQPEVVAQFESCVRTAVADEPAFKLWASWLISRTRAYAAAPTLRNFVRSSGIAIAAARIAVIEKDIAWVREKKNQYNSLSIDVRLATIFASPILASDERAPWLRQLARRDGHATSMEKWMAQMALDDNVDHSFADDELPF